ncbi:hypothetical protein [Staphylococcus chromogenes]|uniref:hypothetical protein n=1 Tax=Staphylococcus chromogenes TaxID=46126 RepID=UPI002888CCED|nr:hypothetical protein [Staphylococcus chromogenes]MDT0700319.1 hypothetical protein [Staphylococcus chromogenes]
MNNFTNLTNEYNEFNHDEELAARLIEFLDDIDDKALDNDLYEISAVDYEAKETFTGSADFDVEKIDLRLDVELKRKKKPKLDDYTEYAQSFNVRRKLSDTEKAGNLHRFFNGDSNE